MARAMRRGPFSFISLIQRGPFLRARPGIRARPAWLDSAATGPTGATHLPEAAFGEGLLAAAFLGHQPPLRDLEPETPALA